MKMNNTKLMNDLISFVAMVAIDGYNKTSVDEWISRQDLDSEVENHLRSVLSIIAKAH